MATLARSPLYYGSRQPPALNHALVLGNITLTLLTSPSPAATDIPTAALFLPPAILRDTSQSAFAARNTAVLPPAPIFNYQHTAPDKPRYIFSETSRSTAKTLYVDAVKSFFNYQHTAPDRIHVTPTDTTQQTDLARGIPTPTAGIDVLQPYIVVYFWKRIA